MKLNELTVGLRVRPRVTTFIVTKYACANEKGGACPGLN